MIGLILFLIVLMAYSHEPRPLEVDDRPRAIVARLLVAITFGLVLLAEL